MLKSPIEVILVPTLIIMLGYFLKRTNVLKVEDSVTLNNIVLKISLPSLIFSNVAVAKIDAGMVMLPVSCLFITLFSALIGYIYAKIRKYPTKQMWAIIIACGLINSGFMGFPIITGAFGHIGFVHAVFFDLSTAMMFVVWGVILVLVFGGSQKDVIKRLISFIPVWAILFGVLFNIFNIGLPNVIMTTLTYLGNATIPLIMLSVGLSLKFKEIRERLSDSFFVSSVRLLLAPLVMSIVLGFFAVKGLNYNVAVLESGMSSAMNGLVLAIDYKLDVSLITACIFTTTVLCLVTVPIVMTFL